MAANPPTATAVDTRLSSADANAIDIRIDSVGTRIIIDSAAGAPNTEDEACANGAPVDLSAECPANLAGSGDSRMTTTRTVAVNPASADTNNSYDYRNGGTLLFYMERYHN